MLLGNQNSAHNLPTNFINGGTFSSYPYFSAFCNIGLGQSPSVQNNSVACFSINNIPAFNANFPFVYGWDGGFVILPDFTALTANGGANYANADVDGITAGNGQSIVFEVWTGGSAGTFYNIWNSNSWNNKPPMLPNS
jgi:hypothetical protein